MNRNARWTVVALAGFVVACGGTQSQEPENPSDEGPLERTQPWADMTAEQRGQYMKRTVLPEMKRLFVQFDAREFSDMDCRTCHGANMREVRFKMPNRLEPLRPDRIAELVQSDRTGGFMARVVTPKMIELLGLQPYDPATQQGFGCLGCHATATGESRDDDDEAEEAHGERDDDE